MKATTITTPHCVPDRAGRAARLLLAGLLLAGAPIAAEQDDESVLRPQAYLTQDTALLDRLLHPSFVVIDPAGNRSSKQEELENLRAEPWNPGSFEYPIDRLDIFEGRFAVIAGRGIAENYSYVSSNYLIKIDGRWQAIGSHVSGFARRDSAE